LVQDFMLKAGRKSEEGEEEEPEGGKGIGSRIPLGPEDEDDEFVEGVLPPPPSFLPLLSLHEGLALKPRILTLKILTHGCWLTLMSHVAVRRL